MAMSTCRNRPSRTAPNLPTARWLLLFLLSWVGLCAHAADGSRAEGSAAERRAAFVSLIHGLAPSTVDEKLAAVNRFFNAMVYRSDQAQWGQTDHWSTPGELLTRGAGDCEDLAIAKYFALRHLGIAESALRITYVRDVVRDRAHMVLVHRGGDGTRVVLDSRGDRPVPRASRADLVSIYGFSERNFTLFTPAGARQAFPHAGRWRVRQWDALLARAAASGGIMGTALLARAPLGH